MRWFSEKLINANIFTISQGYPRMSVDADDYEGQTLLIIGRGKFIASLLLIPIIGVGVYWRQKATTVYRVWVSQIVEPKSIKVIRKRPWSRLMWSLLLNVHILYNVQNSSCMWLMFELAYPSRAQTRHPPKRTKTSPAVGLLTLPTLRLSFSVNLWSVTFSCFVKLHWE